MTSGTCSCKKVAYTFTGEPVTRALCHCVQCQQLCGTAFTYNVVVPRESFTFTAGQPKKSSFIQEIGAEITYHFCPDCSTVLIKETEAEIFKTIYFVQAGTIEGASAVQQKPDVELWVSRRAPWVASLAGVEQKAGF